MFADVTKYPTHHAVGTLIVPAGLTRALDFGLSAALHLWTEELLDGDVQHWHRYAVEINTLRNDLRAVDPVDVQQPELSIPVRLGSWSALVAAALTCAVQGPALADARRVLHELALEAERVVMRNAVVIPASQADPRPAPGAPSPLQGAMTNPAPATFGQSTAPAEIQ
jgi:hypothetical protein